MVSGHLQVKKGFYYVVLSYYNNNGKRRVKYFSTGLPEKGNKRKAEAELARIRSEFVPPQEVGELASDMPFADYLLEWLEIVKVRVKATTFSSYEQMVKSVIEPYFRKKAVTLQGLEARHIQQFYSEKLKTVKPNSVIHYHAVIHQALKYAMKTDLVTQNVAMKVNFVADRFLKSLLPYQSDLSVAPLRTPHSPHMVFIAIGVLNPKTISVFPAVRAVKLPH